MCYGLMGKKEEEHALKQKVVDYTLAPIPFLNEGSKERSATFLGSVAIRELGQKEKADQIMNEWLGENLSGQIGFY